MFFCFGALGTSLGEGQTSDAHSHPIPWAGLGRGGCCRFASAAGPKNPVVPCLGLRRRRAVSPRPRTSAFLQNGLWGRGGLLFFLIEFPAAATQPVCIRPVPPPPTPSPSPCRGTHLGTFRCLCSPSGCRHQPPKRAAPQPATALQAPSTGVPSETAPLRAAPFGRHSH